MKKSKKFFALVLSAVMALSALSLPAFAAGTGLGGAKYPTVFVHGLLGWGSYDEVNDLVPYFGMTTGDLTAYLTSRGSRCYAASVGPLSSAWDRACELYAQMKGAVVDYGAAHAAKYGHSRWGQDFSGTTGASFQKLLPDRWDADHPVNLVGHSFGGATIRLMEDLLADGSAEETAYAAAHPDAEHPVSPLFTGGKADWVQSITVIAAPSNGTTFIEANANTTAAVSLLMTAMAKSLGISDLKGVYDFQLDQFGIYSNSNETVCQTLSRVLSSGFLLHNDNAFQDLTIDKALDINKNIQMQDGVYYYSYYGNRTVYSYAAGAYMPSVRMWLPLQPFSLRMDRYYGATAGSYYDGYGKYEKLVKVTPTAAGKSWQPNDGMVNVVSGQWPYHLDNGAVVNDPHSAGTPGMTGAAAGCWYVMPQQSLDHVGIVGGMLNEGIISTHILYNGMMKNIVNCGG